MTPQSKPVNESAQRESAQYPMPALDDRGEYWRWCPRCSHELENQHCKLRCPRCHYFMSCSDFD